MFFMMGIMDSRKDLDYSKMVICNACGAYGRMQVFMTYTVLSLFFIPCFKWNKRYYVQMSCCNSIYELNEEIGRRIANGEDITISESDMHLISEKIRTRKRCTNCAYETDEDFAFCPKCGKEF